MGNIASYIYIAFKILLSKYLIVDISKGDPYSTCSCMEKIPNESLASFII